MVKRVLAGVPTQLSTYGFGPRKALLLHCSLAHGGVYTKLGAAVGGALTVTSFDQPGHGRAADWQNDCDLQDKVRDMALELMTEPVDLIGHSFGGVISLRLAAERPEMVRTLTLIEPVMMAVAKADNPMAEDIITREMTGFHEAMERGDRETAARVFTASYGDGRPWDSLSEQSRKAITDRIHMISAGQPAVQQDLHNLVGANAFSKISAPTLIIDGGLGGPVMDSVCDGLARRIPNSTRVCIPQGGHMVPLTRPNAVGREILQLVSQSPAL
ncbi:alpha/beta fold hydrolase [Planktotalea sp.]|uniref:alpha/beta fold hydrolase n=1 Tax=Planktotalea sp. TaxID=2029877 RepID=UPI003D6C197F